jgi:hypothetical protein
VKLRDHHHRRCHNAGMDDVVAVEVRLADGDLRYFLTWGRIQHAVDRQPLCDLVLQASRSFSLGGLPISARICTTLREATESANAPYFYECYLSFCHKPVPAGRTTDAVGDCAIDRRCEPVLPRLLRSRHRNDIRCEPTRDASAVTSIVDDGATVIKY